MTSAAPPPPARPRGHRVNFFQLIGLLLAFVLVASVGGVLAAGLFIPAAAGAKAITDTTTEVFDDLPTALEPGPLSQASTFYYSDGKTVLATFYDENRIVVPLSKVSPIMQEAMVATEDKRFFEHGGIDVTGTLRALVNNATNPDDIQGASTLTQQYVKNVLIEQAVEANDPAAVQAARAQTTDRKLREAKLAISLETKMSKDDILAGYLNIAQFGSKVYGVEAAARYYFSTTAAKLTAVQAATIAGITQAPTKYDPTLHPADSQRKRNVVLNDMYTQGYITKAEYDTAIKTPIAKTLKVTQVSNGCQTAGDSAAFCDYVTHVITNNDDNAFSSWGKTAAARMTYLKRGGLQIVTTINKKDQAKGTSYLRKAVPPNSPSKTTNYNKNTGGEDRIKIQLASALSSVQPGTGKITTMVQSTPYDASSKPKKGATAYNWNADELHGGGTGMSPGSSFKPYVLAEWLASGKSLFQMINATPRNHPASEFTAPCISGWSSWNPGNSEGSESGPMTVEDATNNSVNTGYAAMATQLDLCKIGKMADAIGFHGSDKLHPTTEVVGPSMVLGTQNTTPLYQAAAYATFASGGTRCDPIAISSITNSKGDKLQVPSAHCDSDALDPNIANTVTYALRNVLVTGTAAGDELAGNRPASGKTGTANRAQQGWFVGYTPEMSTAVWTGNPTAVTDLHNITVKGTNIKSAQGEQSYLYGNVLSAPIWKEFMDYATKGEPKTAFPAPDPSLATKPKAPVKTGKDSSKDDSGKDSSKDDSGKDSSGDSSKGDSSNTGGGNTGGGNTGGGNTGGGHHGKGGGDNTGGGN